MRSWMVLCATALLLACDDGAPPGSSPEPARCLTDSDCPAGQMCTAALRCSEADGSDMLADMGVEPPEPDAGGTLGPNAEPDMELPPDMESSPDMEVEREPDQGVDDPAPDMEVDREPAATLQLRGNLVWAAGRGEGAGYELTGRGRILGGAPMEGAGYRLTGDLVVVGQ